MRLISHKFLLLIAAVSATFLVYTSRRFDVVHRTRQVLHSRSNELAQATNSTLGFEKIVVVSTGPSWRIEGLRDAAELTGLELEVPEQPHWSSAEVDAFRGYKDKSSQTNIGPGQTKCWLGHLHALKHVIDSGWSTALILEDDVDWDIAIKKQLVLVAPHVHDVTNSTYHGPSQPYGNAWDMLWIGHCGDAIPPHGAIDLFDDTLPKTSLYRENGGEYIHLTAEPQRRMVHISDGPVCTYAYAITRTAATKIVKYARKGMKEVITTDLRHWCQAGFLLCVTVNPELFHHHKKGGVVTSEIAVAEGWTELAAPPPVDFTANIRYSARCNSKSGVLINCQNEFDGPKVETEGQGEGEEGERESIEGARHLLEWLHRKRRK